MASSSTEESLCDGQHDFPEKAYGMCLVHQDLVCLQCLIDKKETECNVKRIDNLSPSENSLFEVLKIKQCLAERKDLVQSHTKNVHEQRDDLKDKIKHHAEELVRKVRENEKKTLLDLETQSKALLIKNDDHEKRIQELECEISVKTKLFSEDADSIKKNEVNDLQTKLQNIAVMADNTVSGSYVEKLTLSGDSNGLGTVEIIDQSLIYDVVQDNAVEMRDKTGRSHSSQVPVCHDVISTGQSPETGPKPTSPLHTPVDQNTASDEVTPSAVNTETGPGSSNREENKTTKTKSRFSLFGYGKSENAIENEDNSTRGKGSTRTQETRNKYPEFNPFPGLRGSKNEHFLVLGSSAEAKVSKPSISNILVTDQNALILFDQNKHKVIVSNFSGKIMITHALSKDPIKLTKFKENSFAILNSKKLKIKVFSIENKELTISDVKMSGSLPKPIHVLGFEYGNVKDCQQFALSGIVNEEGRVIFINAETGKVSDVQHQFKMSSSGQHHNPRDFRTLYDFEKNAIFILNIRSRTMKCFSFEKLDFEWKIQCNDDSFAPDQVVFDDENLYITSNENITLFSKTSGKTKTTHTANIGKVNAICLMKDHRLAIVSSDSTEPQKSMTLEFIPL
ncbi:uncharacterized protein LOC128205463 [Mya arenaria]|uniref:uncharacterized protein LOC128205463 n=1 Tax=Mya arenaria TaxID=6604 RepID=UPI0022E4577D|nr:uncharacterized protein LOC128205463 [Mya arenaria]